ALRFQPSWFQSDIDEHVRHGLFPDRNDVFARWSGLWAPPRPDSDDIASENLPALRTLESQMDNPWTYIFFFEMRGTFAVCLNLGLRPNDLIEGLLEEEKRIPISPFGCDRFKDFKELLARNLGVGKSSQGDTSIAFALLPGVQGNVDELA